MKPVRTLSQAFVALALVALTGCSGTLDSVGGDSSDRSSGVGGSGVGGSGVGGSSGALSVPQPLTGPATYPNAFKDLLGKTDAEIDAKVSLAFSRLFHGDMDTEAIYFSVGTDQALIRDVLHNDVRSEGIAVGMTVAVELDKREEFDRLWTYAQANLEQATGPGRGYFNSICDDMTPCLDPYGMQQFVTALLFAHGRWGSTTAAPYGSQALKLLALLKDKETENGGVISNVTSVFDATTALAREQPSLAMAGYTRSSLQMPGTYELWAQASGDPFWARAAAASRALLVASADPTTGLWPMRNYFDGSAATGFDSYRSQAFRTQINLALDAAWGGGRADQTAIANRVLAFFTKQGLNTYGAAYSIDGTVLDSAREAGLVSVNGALASAGTVTNRTAFVNAVWSQAIPNRSIRYYDGILYLMSVLVLSGQYRIY
ncbi:MAG: glycosyl hydrolase family 8 [Polyangiaceae bacterium]